MNASAQQSGEVPRLKRLSQQAINVAAVVLLLARLS
jgi:hypothetical protein